MAKDRGTITKSTNGRTNSNQSGKKSGGLMSGLKRASKGKGKKGKDSEESEDESMKEYVLQSSWTRPLEVMLTKNSESESSDGGQAATPPKTPNAHANTDKVISGRVVKRISPRKATTTNYKKLEDPFAGMESANENEGEGIFGGPERSEEEDSNPTDEEYGKQRMPFKMEEDNEMVI